MPSADLNVRLKLTDQMSGGLRKGQSKIRGFVSGATKSLFSLRSAFIGLAAFGIGRFIKSTVDAADKIGKLSDRLGESTEFISRFRFAGDQAGVAANNLDTALQRVNRRFGEIAEFGRGEALPALRALGDALGENLVKRVQEGEKFSSLLPTIARGFANIKDETKKLAIAFKLFDTEGVGLLQLLKGGEESILEKFAEAKRVFTDEDVKKAAKLKDEIGKLTDAFGRVKDEMVLGVVPALTEVLSGFLVMKEAADEWATSAFTSFFIASDSARDFVNNLLREKNRLRGDSAADQDPAGKVRPGDPGSGVRGLGETMQDVRRRLAGPPRITEQEFKRRLVGGRSDRKRQGKRQGLIPSSDLSPLEGGGFIGPQGQTPQNFISPKDFTSGLGKFGDFSGLTDINDKLAKQGELLRGVELGVGDMVREFSTLNIARNAIKDVSFALSEGISDNLSSIIEGTKSFKQAFADMAQGAVKELQRIIVRALVLKAVMSAFGSFGGGGGGLGAIFNSAQTASTVNQSFPTNVGLGPAPGFAHGGFVPPGQIQRATLHGGRFGEAIIPLGRRFGSQGGMGGGGGGTTINYFIQAIDVEDFDKKVLGSVARRDTEFASIVASRARNSAALRGSFELS